MNRAARLAVAVVAFSLLLGRAALAEPRSSPATVVEPTAKPLPPELFRGVDEKMTLAQILDRLGPPHRETGSGLCIFVWRVADGREFWVGTSRCAPAERPIYARFSDSAP
jgi:hypothetical protein